MIKVIALDIYGTVLASDDPDNELPLRRGLERFFDNCASKKIKIVSASDAPIETTKIDLETAGIDTERFDRFYQLNQLPRKDFSIIVRDYHIKPRQLLVIGDNYDKDAMGAIEHGACFLQVPKYSEHLDDFDFSKIGL